MAMYQKNALKFTNPASALEYLVSPPYTVSLYPAERRNLRQNTYHYRFQITVGLAAYIPTHACLCSLG